MAPPPAEPSRLDDLRFEGAEPPRFDPRAFLFSWAVGLLLPRCAYWARWPSRLRGSRLALYLAFMTAQGMAVRYWLVPWIRRLFRGHERAREELRAELGHEPSHEEMVGYLADREGLG